MNRASAHAHKPGRASTQDQGRDSDPEESQGSDTAPASRKRPGLSLKGRAIGYLSRREHSRLELQRKLAPYADDDTQLQRVLDELEQGQWLSNERFAQSLVHRRAGRQGASRIMQELRQHGLGDDAVSDIGEQLRETERDRAQAVWEKKFSYLPADPKDYARQYRFLASRGFAVDVIRRILGDIPYGA
ncbi:recombination regulator RecX [Allopusillimonas ginsengisoli]|uniref:recombination regulator RecX n=1 Tax=Allopusillimonas ginsengisoli TaxID=453575 RepID=UPI0010216846|nr:recombination regulator RecX [Allopusillimonas ginsengisoli]